MGISMVPEGRRVFPYMSVRDNLLMGAFTRSDKAEIAASLEMVLGRFPRLKERYRQPAGTMSGGEQQMLVIGRALMAKPRLLLLDEPSLGLAPRVAAQIMALLRKLRDDTGLTVLLVEQNARSALSVADRGIVLSLGRIVASDEPAALAADDALRHAYLGF
jgi:branched-chain amino acid transport system ATP-binding protein